ncbi:MAG: glycogen synthase GlgA [Epulopiscium sp.]|nr:glycogen synthase GlgA [Candidatus Epulonipiscium sp.]
MDLSHQKILFVSAEAIPFAKTGGLGDVAGALPYALKKLGADVRVVIPKYKCVSQKYMDESKIVAEFPVYLEWRKQFAHVHEYEASVPVYFIENDNYFDRDDGLYGYEDDHERFAFFCKAVLDMLPRIGFKPDIIHCNDWQTGPICLLLKEKYHEDLYYRSISTLYTIHNIQYQGIFGKEVLDLLGVPDWCFNPEGVEFYGNVSYMKAGLVYSDAINTVSNTYAEEIKTSQYGYGLEGVLQKRSNALYGIINGIDYEAFNPETDTSLYVPYSKKSLHLKKENKKRLQKDLGLPQKDVPMIGLISRLVDQKGLNLIAEKMHDLMQEDIQFVVLGTGQYQYEEMFKHMQNTFPEKVSANILFNLDLAQKIYASSDLFLMPSLFEPCGLGQLISLRYGTIPIVRKTGGLADTIQAFDEATCKGNGFVFDNFNSDEMLGEIKRALKVYQDKDKWKLLIENAMDSDYSWEDSAKKYIELYKRIQE